MTEIKMYCKLLISKVFMTSELLFFYVELYLSHLILYCVHLKVHI